MRFVWVMRKVPFNPESGAMLYSSGLMQALLETGATATLIAFERPGAEGVTVPGLQIQALRATRKDQFRFLSLFSGEHSDAYRHRTAELERTLRQALLGNPDVLVVDYFCMGWVLPIVEEAVHAGARRPFLLHIAHNHESSVRAEVAEAAQSPWMRSVLRIDAAKVQKLEQKLLSAVDLLVVITEDDQRKFRQDAPSLPILALTPGYRGKIAPTSTIDSSRPRRVVIGGAFDWIAKQINLRRFLQAAEMPFRVAGIDVLVAGRAPQGFIDELSGRYPSWKFLGPVKDMEPYLRLGRIGVMPDEVGGGFKLKYLSYIFAGLPVATIRSQVVGLPIDPERDMLTGETADELVAAIVDSMDDLPRLNGMRLRCWEACADAFHWSDRGVLLRQTIDRLHGTRTAASAGIVARPMDSLFAPNPKDLHQPAHAVTE